MSSHIAEAFFAFLAFIAFPFLVIAAAAGVLALVDRLAHHANGHT